MKISSTRYPIDILICIIWSIVLILIALLSTDIIVRTILGLPMVLFIPGYVLLFALFPTKKGDKGIDKMERIAFSFGLSVAIVPLLVFVLNYTPWGIRLGSILLFLFIFIFTVGFIALYRWINTPPDKRYVISFDISLPKSGSNINNILVILLIISILIAAGSVIYVIINPRNGESFTEFYILDSTGKIAEYPKNLSRGENASVIIGLVNHEYKPMNYTIEIWLVDKKTAYNEITHENETIYPHMWFMDKISVPLHHFNANQEKWELQWEYHYNFSVGRVGKYALTFLLFTTPTGEYNSTENYREIAAQKIEGAYENIYIWLNVH